MCQNSISSKNCFDNIFSEKLFIAPSPKELLLVTPREDHHNIIQAFFPLVLPL